MRTDNAGSGIVGQPQFEVDHEEDHFYVCQHCGQAVDMRELGEVLHHEQDEHSRLECAS